jgi:UDP-N-acetyl-D-mannosaminuronate dehydrogenase
VAREINDRQPNRQLDRVAGVWRSLSGQSVHLLGLGFRPGVKVDTFSPAYALRSELVERSAQVTLSDPCYSDDELTALGFTPGLPQAAKVVVLNTAHVEFASPDFSAWKAAGVEVVVDGRNYWSQAAAERAGLIYLGIGRAASAASRRDFEADVRH